MNKYIKILLQKEISPSQRRVFILKYLSENREHQNADEIYKYISKIYPKLSKTTVYNTLQLFVKRGILNPLIIDGIETRFDIQTFPHAHFKCNKCNKIYDVFLDEKFFNFDNINENFKIEEVNIILKGLCDKCN